MPLAGSRRTGGKMPERRMSRCRSTALSEKAVRPASRRTYVFVWVGLLVLLLLLPAAPLRAEDFRRFSVLVPDGWEVTERPEEMFIFRPPAGDAAAVIICAPLPDRHQAADVLEAFVRYFSGSEPQQRERGGQTFDFARNGQKNSAFFLHDTRSYLLLTVSDPHERYPECLTMLMDSLALR